MCARDDDDEIVFSCNFATSNLDFGVGDLSAEIGRMFGETQLMHLLLSSLGWQDQFVAQNIVSILET